MPQRPVFDTPRSSAIAHRGSRILWPENTMPAFQGAVDLGYRWLETDLQLTADGVLVTFHDPTLDRTTDAGGPVSSQTFADLTRVDAGAQHEGFAGQGIGVPSLEELLLAFPDVHVVLDLKRPGLAHHLWSLLRRLGAVDRVVVGSFSDRRLAEFRKVSGGAVATSTGPIATLGTRAGSTVRRVRSRADAIQVPRNAGRLRLVTEKTVAAHQRAGMVVHVWTVNDPVEMAELLDLGVDGLITDRPDLLKDLLVSRGRWD